jgi:hypothetical protein
LLIIIGTSLQVQPFASLIDEVPETVPRLLINKEMAGVHKSKDSGFDVFYSGVCDEGIVKLAQLLGWEKDLDRLYTKGTHKLKNTYVSNEEESEEDKPEKAAEQEEDKEVDQLAAELQKLTAEDKMEKVEKKDKTTTYNETDITNTTS